MDENPPGLSRLTIQGYVFFDPNVTLTLSAEYIVVMGQGVLAAGSPGQPFNGSLTIVLNGTRQTPDWALTNTVNMGAKVRNRAGLCGCRVTVCGPLPPP